MRSFFNAYIEIFLNLGARFYHSIYFSYLIYVVTSIVLFFLIKKLGFWNKAIKFASVFYISLKSFFDAHSVFIKEFFGNVIVFWIAYECFERLTDHSLLVKFIALAIAFIKALWKSLRIKKGIGQEFENIYDSKLELSKLYQYYSKERPPYFYPQMTNIGAIETLIRDVFSSQVNFIAKTFKPGWSWGGHEFSVSILFFNYNDSKWHLFDTFYEENATKRPASDWPIHKDAFVFSNDMYTYQSNRIFNVMELDNKGYESVLQIPLYFRKNHKGENEKEFRKGRIFAIVSFASRKKEAFQKVERNSQILRRFFIPEIYILEKYIYKLYRTRV